MSAVRCQVAQAARRAIRRGRGRRPSNKYAADAVRVEANLASHELNSSCAERALLLTLRLQRVSTGVGSAGQVRNGLPVRDESKLILSIMSLARFTRNKPPAEETRNSKAQSPSKSKSRNPNHKEGRAPERVSLTFWVAIQLLKNDGDFALLHASPDSYLVRGARSWEGAMPRE